MSELEPRVAVLEARANDHAEELRNTRVRLHNLESDRSVLQIMVQQVAEIRADIKSLLGTQAADDAVRKWKWRAAALVVALLGVIATLLLYHPNP